MAIKRKILNGKHPVRWDTLTKAWKLFAIPFNCLVINFLQNNGRKKKQISLDLL